MNHNRGNVCANVRIYAYARDVQTTTSLHILNAVEEVVDALGYEQNRLSNHLQAVEDLILRINSCQSSTEIDPDDEIQELLLKVEKGLSNRYTECKKAIKSAKSDGNLNGEHEESVVTEYNRSMDAVSRLYDTNERLRFLIMEFDADLSPVTGSFNNADDLIAHLKVS